MNDNRLIVFFGAKVLAFKKQIVARLMKFRFAYPVRIRQWQATFKNDFCSITTKSFSILSVLIYQGFR
jgi:hypothetical protein